MPHSGLSPGTVSAQGGQRGAGGGGQHWPVGAVGAAGKEQLSSFVPGGSTFPTWEPSGSLVLMEGAGLSRIYLLAGVDIVFHSQTRPIAFKNRANSYSMWEINL